MRLKTVGLVILACSFVGRVHGDVKSTQTEQELAAVIEWEMLWAESPGGFRIPAIPLAHLAIHLTSDSVSYCSHELHVCVKYRTYNFRNWQEVSSRVCDGKERDEDSIIAFAALAPRPQVKSSADVQLGARGLRGQLQPNSGIIWSANIPLRSRPEIVEQYKTLHPAKIVSLENWLRTTAIPSAGYKSMMIGCFAPSDPEVFVYGDRSSKGPILISIFWDGESEEWTVAGLLEGQENRKRLADMRATVESVACSTVTFP